MNQNADTVRARYNSDANAGLDPADPSFIDTTEGGYFWDITQAGVLEDARQWDFLGTEMPAAAFPGTAWGDYLDLHAETLGMERIDEVEATGTVSFVGVVGTLIPAGTQVATVQPDPSALTPPVVFATDRTITLAVLPGPTNLVATPSATGGTLPAGVFYYMVTAITASGETIGSNEAAVTLSGSTSSVALAWTAVAGATAYRIYRGSTAAAEALLASPGGVGTTYSDTGAAAPGTAIVPTNTVGVTAVAAGSSGNVGSNTIKQVLSALSGAPTVTNPAATSGGSDVESDDRLRLRILAEYGRASGGGNVSDYIRWGTSIPQVGFVTVQPLWNGAGTVRLIITDQRNQPVSASIVTQLQTYLDPVPQQGQGQAPVGALVTTVTPTLLTVNTAATISHASGYTLDGASGTIPTRAAVQAAIQSYLTTLAPGATVVLNAIIRQIMAVPGVVDVSGVQLNGVAANVAVGGLQVATPGTITLA